MFNPRKFNMQFYLLQKEESESPGQWQELIEFLCNALHNPIAHKTQSAQLKDFCRGQQSSPSTPN